MNGRERQLATIRHEIPDRISVDAIAIETQAEIAAYLGIDRTAVLDRLGIDGRVVLAPYLGTPDQPVDGLAEFTARAECAYLVPNFDHDPGMPPETHGMGHTVGTSLRHASFLPVHGRQHDARGRTLFLARRGSL